MNNYDPLMYLILNKILMLFGMRIVADQRIVFIYRIKNYTNPNELEHAHIIRLTNDVSKAFGFLNMDYDDYKKQQFKNIFEFTDWVTRNCTFLTLDIVKNIEKEVNSTPKKDRTELLEAAKRFTETIKVGHIILRNFSYIPIIMYLNLRESIVRNYFTEDEVQEQFVDLKLRYLRDSELPNKFSPKHVVTWLAPLRTDSKLVGIFIKSFVDYMTGNDSKLFPRFLIDTDISIVKKEVISYYYNLFPNTKAYLKYKGTLVEEENEVADVSLLSEIRHDTQ